MEPVLAVALLVSRLDGSGAGLFGWGRASSRPQVGAGDRASSDVVAGVSRLWVRRTSDGLATGLPSGGGPWCAGIAYARTVFQRRTVTVVSTAWGGLA